jgi:hypothetical protein
LDKRDLGEFTTELRSKGYFLQPQALACAHRLESLCHSLAAIWYKNLQTEEIYGKHYNLFLGFILVYEAIIAKNL